MDLGKIDLYVAIEYQYNSNIQKVGFMALQPPPMMIHANTQCHLRPQMETLTTVCNNKQLYTQK